MPTIPEISFCLCCGKRIEYHPEVGYWTHPDGTRHYDHCARPVNELELARAEIVKLQREIITLKLERDSLREILYDYHEMPY